MKLVKRRAMSLLIAFSLCISLMGTALAANEQVNVWAEKTGNGIAITVSVKNASFNVLQFAIEYDKAVLTPCSSTGAAADNATAMTQLLAPEYERGKGWVAGSKSGRLDMSAGVVEHLLYVDPGARGRAADEDGFVSAPTEGLDVLKLHFIVKEGAHVRSDSIQLTGTSGNPTGIILGTKGSAEQGGVSIVDSPSVVTVDLSAVVTADDSGSAGDNGSTGDSGSSDGNGTTGGNNGSSGSGTGGSTGQGSTDVEPAALTDISKNWAKDSIQRLVKAGVLNGYPDGTFRPDNYLTRAEFCIVICAAMDLSTSGVESPFADTADAWAAPYIGAAYEAGYVNGKGGSLFGPEEWITREQMAVILCRAKGLTSTKAASFTDADSISGWARDAVNAAAEAGILQGGSDGALRPQDRVTRAEMAVMVDRLLERT